MPLTWLDERGDDRGQAASCLSTASAASSKLRPTVEGCAGTGTCSERWQPGDPGGDEPVAAAHLSQITSPGDSAATSYGPRLEAKQTASYGLEHAALGIANSPRDAMKSVTTAGARLATRSFMSEWLDPW